ncbi:protein of unknown function [Poseidonocella sedimentorum]|uniref:DUF4393 domain-containing protein n=1 Tax=Poseidonocella sedimentorum TaxID=871652 RepID=A0A1I6DIF6_9RHOB|nr:protein of unknown function [Poseidonocella sedimentorum]
MSEDDGSGDLAGIGKVAQAIPEAGWTKAIDTACDTFSDLIAPITKTTAGLGALIQAKFDAMIDVQKVFAADAVQRARQKTQNLIPPENQRPSARVLVKAIEEASLESDENLRDIWANLIANEIHGGAVHPVFPQILSQLSASDALVLAQIAEKNAKKTMKAYARALTASVSVFGFGVTTVLGESSDAHHEYLDRLGLVEKRDGFWSLTHFGEEFVAAVTDPSFSVASADV